MNGLRTLAAAFVCLALAAAPAAGQPADPRTAVQQGKAVPLQRVLQQVMPHFPGRLLKADLVNERGRLVYKLRILGDDGQVTHVTADARSGGVLDVRGAR